MRQKAEHHYIYSATNGQQVATKSSAKLSSNCVDADSTKAWMRVPNNSYAARDLKRAVICD